MRRAGVQRSGGRDVNSAPVEGEPVAIHQWRHKDDMKDQWTDSGGVGDPSGIVSGIEIRTLYTHPSVEPEGARVALEKAQKEARFEIEQGDMGLYAYEILRDAIGAALAFLPPADEEQRCTCEYDSVTRVMTNVECPIHGIYPHVASQAPAQELIGLLTCPECQTKYHGDQCPNCSRAEAPAQEKET